MEIIHLNYPIRQEAAAWQGRRLSIAIGHFDGVHRGHQNVIRAAVDAAVAKGLSPAVLTFSPHPKEVLGYGDQYYRCLTPLDRKLELFAELGVEAAIVMRFDRDFAAVQPAQFVDEVLAPLGARHAVVGFDFTFGSKGAGNADMLKRLCEPQISVQIVQPLEENGVKVSSTLTRQALEQGELETVRSLLGRSYEVSGTVVGGDRRGRTIGFPTANVELRDPYVTPRLGVYAITAWVDGVPHGGVLNYGMKPTFNTGEVKPVMEAHLFDFDADIYGKPIRVQLRTFIRPERKFGAVAELVAQIGADAETAKVWLRTHGLTEG